jgi:hypothetical protein
LEKGTIKLNHLSLLNESFPSSGITENDEANHKIFIFQILTSIDMKFGVCLTNKKNMESNDKIIKIFYILKNEMRQHHRVILIITLNI